MQASLQKDTRRIPNHAVGLAPKQRFLARLRHFSILIYATEPERVQRLLPPSFSARESLVAGRSASLISVISHLDIGEPGVGASSFEQTSYRISARYGGRQVHWLLGISIGSLSALPARGLWLAPTNLGAMEFKTSYSDRLRRYVQYRLSTQSRWENAAWEVAGDGAMLDPADLRSHLDSENIRDFFLRRDGAIGARHLCYSNSLLQRGTLIAARSDLLTKLELLTPETLARPLLVALGSRLTYKFDAPHPDFGPAHRSIFAGEELRSNQVFGR